MGITLRQLTNTVAKVKDYCNKVALHKNMKVLDKLSEENDTLLFDGKPIQGNGSGGSNVSSSTENGYIVVDGTKIKVYDDTDLKKIATHDNRTAVLDKLTVSSNGELLYNNKKIGLNSYRKDETIQINTEENTLILNVKEHIPEQYILNNIEILVHDLSTQKSSEISIYDKNTLLETITMDSMSSQRYNLGMNSDLVIYGKGNVNVKVTMLFTANNSSVTEIH